MADTPDHYEVLGVARDATPEQIKAAWRAKSRAHHPDRHMQASAEERVEHATAMQRINQAWEVLGDPVRRAQYDQTGDSSNPQEQEETMAHGTVVSLFESALGSDHVADLVAWVHSELLARSMECTEEIKKAQREVKRLEAKRKSIRRKDQAEPNMVHAMVDARIKAVQATIPANERVQRVLERCRKLVDEYETVKEPGFDASHDSLMLAGIARLGSTRKGGFYWPGV